MTDKKKTENNDYDNLIKNFYLFGIDPDEIILSDFDEQNYLNEDFLHIKLLSKFPPNEKKSLIPPNIIISHSFPKGYSLKLSKENLSEEYEFFHFNLKNLLSVSLDDKRIYFTCCIFYENLTQYLSIKNLKNNSLNKKENLSNKNIKPEYIYVPKLICISSFIPYPTQFRTILEKLIIYTKKNNIQIPIEKEIENLILGIPFPKKSIFYPTKRNDCYLNNNIEFFLRDINQKNYYSYKMKSIFYFNIDQIMEIYRCILLEKPILFFSKDKEKLTNIFETFLNLIFPFEYQNPHCAILPDCNAGIIEQTKSFIFGINEEWVDPVEEDIDNTNKANNINNTNNKINYFQRLNLNSFKVILICDIDLERIIPYQRYKSIIMTFNELQSNNYPNYSPRILTTAETNNLFNLNPQKCRLPTKYSEKLKNKLKDKLFGTEQKINFDFSAKSNEIITEDFYYFLVSILKNYNDYLFNGKEDIININSLFFKKNLQKIGVEKLFKVNQFIDKELDKNDDSDFFKIFFETNLFKNFLFRKYRNSEHDKYIFLLFDETIIIKKNKNKFSKTKTEFINSKCFSTTINYDVEKTQNFDKSEYEQIKLKQKQLINYYQKYDGKNLTYYIFPKLLYDNKFFNSNNKKNNWKYLFNEDKLNQIYKVYESNRKKIDTKLFFKIYEGDLVKRYNFNRNDFLFKNESNNIIGCLWICIFCFTFYYCNDIDKKFRFQELMKNLKNLEIPYTAKKLISFIYITLIKYGNDYMLINFYDYLNVIDYDLYNFFCNKMLINDNNSINSQNKRNNLVLKKLDVGNTKLALSYYKDKNEDESAFKRNSLKLSLTIYNDNDDKKNILPKRSFNDNTNNNETEEIIFNKKIKCEFCKKEMELSSLIEEVNNMKKQEELICINCKNFIIPTNLVSVGSFSKNIKIYNPFYLYRHFALNLMKNYGTKIDLDVLKNEYPDFYWNCILYFSFYKYSFDMLIKYKNEKKYENKTPINNNQKEKNIFRSNSKNNVNNKKKGFFNLSIQNQKININSKK